MQHTPFDIPDQMRQAADRSVDQAKKAVEQFLDATQKALANAEGSAKTLREGAAEVNRQAMAFAEENIAASFDFAQKLVRAKSVEELTALQQDFVKKQMASIAEQGKSIGEMVGKATAGAMEKGKR